MKKAELDKAAILRAHAYFTNLGMTLEQISNIFQIGIEDAKRVIAKGQKMCESNLGERI